MTEEEVFLRKKISWLERRISHDSYQLERFKNLLKKEEGKPIVQKKAAQYTIFDLMRSA